MLFSCDSKVSPAPEAEQGPLRHRPKLAVVSVQKCSTVASSVCFPSRTRTFAFPRQPAPSTGHPHHGPALGGVTAAIGQGRVAPVAPRLCRWAQPLPAGTPVLHPGVLEEPGLAHRPGAVGAPRDTRPAPSSGGRAGAGSQTRSSRCPRSPLMHVTAASDSEPAAAHPALSVQEGEE